MHRGHVRCGGTWGSKEHYVRWGVLISTRGEWEKFGLLCCESCRGGEGIQCAHSLSEMTFCVCNETLTSAYLPILSGWCEMTDACKIVLLCYVLPQELRTCSTAAHRQQTMLNRSWMDLSIRLDILLLFACIVALSLSMREYTDVIYTYRHAVCFVVRFIFYVDSQNTEWVVARKLLNGFELLWNVLIFCVNALWIVMVTMIVIRVGVSFETSTKAAVFLLLKSAKIEI